MAKFNLEKTNKDLLNRFLYKFETHVNPLRTSFQTAVNKMAADVAGSHTTAVDGVKKARQTAKGEQTTDQLVDAKVYPEGKSARDAEVRQMWSRNVENSLTLQNAVVSLQPAFTKVNKLLDDLEETNRKYQQDKTLDNQHKLYSDLPLLSEAVCDLQRQYVALNEKLVSELKMSLTTALPRNTMFRLNSLVTSSHEVAASLTQTSEKLLHGQETALSQAQNTAIQSVSGKNSQLAAKVSANINAATFDLQDLEELARSLDILDYSHVQ